MIELEGDLQEPLVEALKPASGPLIRKSATIHFQEVACGRDRLANARGIGMADAGGNGQNGYLVRPSRVLASGVELTL